MGDILSYSLKELLAAIKSGRRGGIVEAIKIVEDEASKQSYNPSSIDRIIEKLKKELGGNGKN